MCNLKVIGFLAIICISLVCESVSGTGSGGTGTGATTPNAAAAARKVRILSANPALSRLFRLLSNNRAGLALDDEDLFGGLEDETYFQKRQYDDYGHMRFGKRNPKDFDDYGHMRFGK